MGQDVGLIQAENTFHIVRDSDKPSSKATAVGTIYLYKTSKFFEFFKRFTEAGAMTMETAGSLKGGKEIWGLAKISEVL